MHSNLQPCIQHVKLLMLSMMESAEELKCLSSVCGFHVNQDHDYAYKTMRLLCSSHG